MTKIWANSADSHVLEPADLWLQSLPCRLAQRAPREATSTRSSTSTASGWTVS